MFKIFAWLIFLMVPQMTIAQDWNGKRCAVLLTYDDGLHIHLSSVVPTLDSFGLKGTFYISDYFDGLRHQLKGWKQAAEAGHELGNHTVYHPCAGGIGRPETDMNLYSVKRMGNEIKSMNLILQSLDGKNKRSFAYPCGQKKIRDTFYIDHVKDRLTAARAVRGEMPGVSEVDLFDLPSYMMSGQSGEEMIGLVKEAMQKGRLLIFLFHGVGGEHSINVSTQAHRELLFFLRQHKNDIWTPTVSELAAYMERKD